MCSPQGKARENKLPSLLDRVHKRFRESTYSIYKLKQFSDGLHFAKSLCLKEQHFEVSKSFADYALKFVKVRK